MNENILLGHGSGGKLTHNLISNLFVKHFSNPILEKQTDSAILEINANNISFTTDSFVVDPLFFNGGDIGKLAVAGTVNDLAVSGAEPLFLSASFIIEEGFSFSELEKIVKSMAEEAKKANIKIVTGDTKVVDRGKCDKVFINTSGIGILSEKNKEISSGEKIEIGDKIIINGTIGDHGMAIMATRNDMNFSSNIKSDCASLNQLIKKVIDSGADIKFMRDATRGGLSTVLCEIVENKSYGIEINEDDLAVNENVRGICELLGFDPVYVANEGKVVMVVSNKDSEKVLAILKKDELGKASSIIGEVVDEHHGKGWINTEIGGKRIIDMLAGEQLPRIC
ncbi:MAG: hydrogenase expression/formation protein HypE [Bacteroidota bacterium]|nr:hydrogenase expression/formation protein HypE [Bacteroidota bacterium]